MPDTLRKDLPVLGVAQTLDAGADKLTVSLVPAGQNDPVKLSFFGGIDFGRVGMPLQSRDGVLWVASLLDLMATKLKVLHRCRSLNESVIACCPVPEPSGDDSFMMEPGP